MNNPQMPVARKEGLVIQEMPDEVLVYDMETNQAHCLNQTAASVWKSCDGVNTVADITKKLEKEFKTSIPEDFVWLAIDQLSKDKLLEQEIETKISGLSRREVIKRIGFASMAVLPVVAMLSFPQTAMAGTCPNSSCSDTEQLGCQGATHCCRGACISNNVPCSPACA